MVDGVGGISVGLTVLFALPDGIWDAAAQVALTGAVVLVAIACAWAAEIIESVDRR